MLDVKNVNAKNNKDNFFGWTNPSLTELGAGLSGEGLGD